MTKFYEIRKDMEGYRASTPDQLRDELASLKKSNSTCVSRRPRARWKRPLASATVRRSIARIKTVLSEKSKKQTA
jgi:ribosomal protein L29